MPENGVQPSREAWTIVLHVTVVGDYDVAELVASKTEAAAKRAGGVDAMLEVLAQGGQS